MSKRKQPRSWADKLDAEALAEPEPAPVEEAPHEDPVVQGVALFHLKRQLLVSEIRAKELEQALYLAKARILELELERLRGSLK
jgi:type IV secretory pathway VirD2 relaxase